LITRAGDTVTSRTVEGRPPGVAPASSTRSTLAPSPDRTAPLETGGGAPLGLALGAVTGAPRQRTSAVATGWDDRRTPTGPVPAVTREGTPARDGITSVRGPGQCRAISSRANGEMTAMVSAISAESTSTRRGLSSGRPFTL